MTQITALSNEVLLIIFSSIDKISQVAECRLVCKHWRNLAETAMLGHNITISSKRGLARLYTMLIQHPDKAKLIKHLHFKYGVKFTDLLKNFFAVAVTYNIESLTGDVFQEAFFDTLIRIAGESPIKFDKLKTLTVSPTIGQPSRDVSLRLVNSIETMKLDFGYFIKEVDWKYVEQLNEFRKLKNLTVEGIFNSFDNLEAILNACPPNLQNLTLTTFAWNKVHNWNKENTQEQHELIELTLDEGFMDHHIANYLVGKFVNLDTINTDIHLYEYFFENKVHLIPSIISRVPNKNVIFTIPLATDLRNVLTQFKSDDYTMNVEDVKEDNEGALENHLELNKCSMILELSLYI